MTRHFLSRGICIISCFLLVPLWLAGSMYAMEWYDESYPHDAWKTVRTEIHGEDLLPGRTTYYFRAFFDLPSYGYQPPQKLVLRITTTEGVVAYAHGTETGRSANLPAGDLSYDQQAEYPLSGDTFEFDLMWLLYDCENSLGNADRIVAIELHRVDPSEVSFSLGVSIFAESVHGDAYLLPVTADWFAWDNPSKPESLNAKAVGAIVRPIPGLPAMLEPGGGFEVVCQPDTPPANPLFLMVNQRAAVPLAHTAMPATEDGLDAYWLTCPPGTAPGMYELRMYDHQTMVDYTPASVGVCPALDGNLSVIHITDSHLPRRGYYRDNVTPYVQAVDLCNLLGPDFVIHTGDGYNEGNARDQAEFFAMTLPDFQMPMAYVAGNHELGEWCGDGSSRYNNWEFFGWMDLDPDAPDHWEARTRDYALDAGPVSFLFLESWENYTHYWVTRYTLESFLENQLTWLADAASARAGQMSLVACYHHDFDDQLWSLLPGLGFRLTLSGHTHSSSQDYQDGVLFLKTGATYSEIRPVRWIRFENGELLETPELRLNSVDIEIPLEQPFNGYGYEAIITNSDYLVLQGLKLWHVLPPGPTYLVENAEKIGQWDTPAGTLVGAEYDLGSHETRTIQITPSGAIQNVSLALIPDSPILDYGKAFTLNAVPMVQFYNRRVRIFAAMEYAGEYYFWPNWSEQPGGLDIDVVPGVNPALEIMGLTWPVAQFFNESVTFFAVLMDPLTGGLVSNIATSSVMF